MRHPTNIPKPVNDRHTVITGIVIATLCNKPSKAAAILNAIEPIAHKFTDKELDDIRLDCHAIIQETCQ
tara:strand:+ start:1724 stop:1930 length:207 start_codon:yes stop_codon:yes gene_type:complete